INPTLSFCCAFPVGMNASTTAITTTAVSQRLTFHLIAACTSGLVSDVLGFWATVRLDSLLPPANRHCAARQRRGNLPARDRHGPFGPRDDTVAVSVRRGDTGGPALLEPATSGLPTAR